ncbi:MAG: hypothetical protein ACO4AV_11005, partial [bacterium]
MSTARPANPQPGEHSINDGGRRGALYRHLHVVLQLKGEVFEHLQQQLGPTTPCTALLDANNAGGEPQLLSFLLRGLPEAPDLIYGVPDGRRTPKPAGFVAVVDQKDGAGREKTPIIVCQPVDGPSKLLA